MVLVIGIIWSIIESLRSTTNRHLFEYDLFIMNIFECPQNLTILNIRKIWLWLFKYYHYYKGDHHSLKFFNFLNNNVLEMISSETVINNNKRLCVAVFKHGLIIPSITNLYLHYTPSVTLYYIHPSVTIIFKIHIITP